MWGPLGGGGWGGRARSGATNQLRRLENDSNFLFTAPQFPKDYCFLECFQAVCPGGSSNM